MLNAEYGELCGTWTSKVTRIGVCWMRNMRSYVERGQVRLRGLASGLHGTRTSEVTQIEVIQNAEYSGVMQNTDTNPVFSVIK